MRCARSRTKEAVQQRTASILGPNWARDSVQSCEYEKSDPSVIVALAATLQNAQSTLQFLLPRHVAQSVAGRSKDLALSVAEWDDLLGRDRILRASREIDVYKIKNKFQCLEESSALYASTLRDTLRETGFKLSLSEQPLVVLATHVALHSNDCEQRLQSIFGCMVKSDMRRVDEVCGELEENSPYADDITMTAAIQELSRAIAL